MTAKEAAEALDCSVRTLNNYHSKGILDRKKEGRTTIYKPDQVLKLAKKINAEKRKNGREPQVIKNNIPFEYDIGEVGLAYVNTCREQMILLDTYESAYEIILYDLGLQYQLYRDYLDASRTRGEMGLAKLADMYYKNCESTLKQLGLTPQSKKTLGARKRTEEKDIFDELKDILS